MLVGPDYEKFLRMARGYSQSGSDHPEGWGNNKSSGAIGSNPGSADPHNPQAMINAAMTGDQHQTLQQGMAQANSTPGFYPQDRSGAYGGSAAAQSQPQNAFVSNGGSWNPISSYDDQRRLYPEMVAQLYPTAGAQQGMANAVIGAAGSSFGGNSPWAQAGPSENGRMTGGLSSLSNAQLQSLVDHYNLGMLNPDDYKRTMSPANQSLASSAQTQMNNQNLGAFDSTQAGRWLDQASWSRVMNSMAPNSNTQQGQNWAKLSQDLMPPPPDPNAPIGYQVGRHQDYIGQQQRAWSNFMGSEKQRLLDRGNLINSQGGGLPINAYGEYLIPQPGGQGSESGSQNPNSQYVMYDTQSGKIVEGMQVPDLTSSEQIGTNPGKAWFDPPKGRMVAINKNNVGSGQVQFFSDVLTTDVPNPSTGGEHRFYGGVPYMKWDGSDYVTPQSGLPPGANSTGLNGQYIRHMNEGGDIHNSMISTAAGQSGGGSSEEGGNPLMAALRQANGLEGPSQGGQGGGPQQQQGGGGYGGGY